MTATVVTIADALVVELNGHQFSQDFAAVRAYLPSYELKDMDTLHVTVVPAEYEGSPNDRTRDDERHTLHIAVQQRFKSAANGVVALDSLDALMALCEEIRDFLRTLVLAGCPDARRVKTETKPIYDPKHLAELGQFTGLLAFTYRIVR